MRLKALLRNGALAAFLAFSPVLVSANELIDLGRIEKRIDKIMALDDNSLSAPLANEIIRLSTILLLDDPKHSTAYFYRAYALDDLGDYQAALEDINRDIEIYPTGESYSLRATIKYNMDDLSGACADWAKGGTLEGGEIAIENYQDFCSSSSSSAARSPGSLRETMSDTPFQWKN